MALPTLTFAGVPLPVWTPAAAAFADRIAGDWRPRNFNDWTWRELQHLPLPPFPADDGPAVVGRVQWPRMASRWATAFVPATYTQLEAVRSAVGNANTPQTLSVGNGTSTAISTSMYLLPPKQLAAVGSGDLWVLPLVDVRWFWWDRPFSTTAAPATWATFLADLGTALGVTLTGDTAIEAVYGVPTDRWAGIAYAPAGLILDAVAESLGRRVVRRLDGTVRLELAATASAVNATNRSTYRSRLRTGGGPAAADVARGLPAGVAVLAGKSVAGLPQTGLYPTTRTFADLVSRGFAAGYAGTATGVAGTTARVTADAVADLASSSATSPSNAAALDGLADVAGGAWYSWRADRHEAEYAGVVGWTPCGFNEWVEWDFRSNACTTTVTAEPLFNPNIYGYYPPGTAGAGSGSGSGSPDDGGDCCTGEPPGDAGACGSGSGGTPDLCPVWYTEYQHLETVAVRVGQSVRPGQLLGWVGRYYTGSHSHFGLGDGPVRMSWPSPIFTIGQTIDVSTWLGYPSEGTRGAGNPARLANFSAAETAYIQSVFAPPLGPGSWKIFYGSPAHQDGEYYANDLFPAGADPYQQNPADQSMAGTPVYNAVAGGADVESTVVFCEELNSQVHSMVVVRHRRRCCPVDGVGSGSGSGGGSGGSGGDTYPPSPTDLPFSNNTITVATGDICITSGAGSGSGSGSGATGLSDDVSSAIVDWIRQQKDNGYVWDGTPFPLVFRIAQASLGLPQNTTIEPAGCTGLSTVCDDICRDPEDCDTTCRTDCTEASDGAPMRFQFYTDATVAGGMTYLDVDTAVTCAWSGRRRTTAFDQDCILYYDSGWTLASPADGTGAVYDLGLDGTFDPLTGGSLVLANPGDPGIEGNYPDTLLIWPACVPACGSGSGSGSGGGSPFIDLVCPGSYDPGCPAQVNSPATYATVSPAAVPPDTGYICVATASTGLTYSYSSTSISSGKKYQVRATQNTGLNGIPQINFRVGGVWSVSNTESPYQAVMNIPGKTYYFTIPAGADRVGFGMYDTVSGGGGACYTIEVDDGSIGPYSLSDFNALSPPGSQADPYLITGSLTCGGVPELVQGLIYQLQNASATGSASGLCYKSRSPAPLTLTLYNNSFSPSPSDWPVVKVYAACPFPTPGTVLATMTVANGTSDSVAVPAGGYFTVDCPFAGFYYAYEYNVILTP